MIINIFSSNGRKKSSTNGSANGYLIGDRVQSPKYGKGVVRAFNPNGTLLVRFEGQKKNRSIFPTLVNRRPQ